MSAIRRMLLRYAPYVCAAALILAPMLGSGYIFALDMVFGPEIRVPAVTQSSFGLYALLWLLAQLLPVWLVQKLLLAAILLLSAVGMHRLVARLGIDKSSVPAYAAGLFYMVNPFVYSRFMAGQFAVLLGYALLPWFVDAVVVCKREPTVRHALVLGGLAAVIGVVSLHTLVALAIFGLVGMALLACWFCHNKVRWGRYMRMAGVGMALFVVVSGVWLVPLVLGRSGTAQLLDQFGAQDAAAFATVGEGLGKLVNLLTLQGFWAEGRALYLLPQDRVNAWGMIALAVLLLAGYGWWQLWRHRPRTTVFFGLSTVLALLLALGALNGLIRAGVPLLGGLREPQKLVSIVALSYSVAIAFGVRRMQAGLPRWQNIAVVVCLAALGGLFTRTMWWGFDGQLSPRHYPDDWHAVNQQLNADTDNFSVLFLPWHQYMRFRFAGRIIASPGRVFFDKPVISSRDPEFGGLPPTADPATNAVASTLKRPDKTLATRLAKQNIRYIIVVRELDYHTYDYLGRQPDLALVRSTPSLLLYRNDKEE